MLLGGALLALDSPAARWSDPSLATVFATQLRQVLNAPDDVGPSEPLLAPPRYGATYRDRPPLESMPPRWYEQLNLDPGARVAAALGTTIVQRHQETLVAAAWDQAADLAAARRLMGLAGFGFAVADSLHRRHVAQLSDDVGLFVLAPLRARLLAAPATGANPSFGIQWAQAQVASAALGTAVRRVARSSGPILRRVGRTAPMPSRIDILSRMAPISRIERNFEPPIGPLTFDTVAPSLPSPANLTWAQLAASAITNAPPRRGFGIAATPQPAGPPRPLPLPGGGVLGGSVLTGGIAAGDLTRSDPPSTGPTFSGLGRAEGRLDLDREPGVVGRRPDDGGGPRPIRDRPHPDGPDPFRIRPTRPILIRSIRTRIRIRRSSTPQPPPCSAGSPPRSWPASWPCHRRSRARPG